jgi:hypothetical protein
MEQCKPRQCREYRTKGAFRGSKSNLSVLVLVESTIISENDLKKTANAPNQESSVTCGLCGLCGSRAFNEEAVPNGIDTACGFMRCSCVHASMRLCVNE